MQVSTASRWRRVPQLALLAALCAGLPKTWASQNQTTPQIVLRELWLNGVSQGVLRVCRIPGELGKPAIFLFDEDGLSKINLRRQGEPVLCEGEPYFGVRPTFIDNANVDQLRGEALPSDYDRFVASADAADTTQVPPLATPVNAWSLVHEASAYCASHAACSTAIGLDSMAHLGRDSLGFVGRLSRSGSGYAFYGQGLSWRRELYERRLELGAGRLGLQGRDVSGGSTLMGVRVARPNEAAVSTSTRPRIEGFMPGPGTALLRRGGSVVKTVALPAGSFVIEDDSVGLSSGSAVAYELELRGDDGTVFSRGPAFGFGGAEGLSTGVSWWEVLAGVPSEGPGRNKPAIGGVWKYGLSERVAVETAGAIGAGTAMATGRADVAFGSAGTVGGSVGLANRGARRVVMSYGVGREKYGMNLNMLDSRGNLQAWGSAESSLVVNTTAVRSASAGGFLDFAAQGRINANYTHTQSRIDDSYATNTRALTVAYSRSLTHGVNFSTSVSRSDGRSQIAFTLDFSLDNGSASVTMQRPQGSSEQWTAGMSGRLAEGWNGSASASLQNSQASGHASVAWSPWYGQFNAGATVSPHSMSNFFSERGALFLADGQLLPSGSRGDASAIVKLDRLPNVGLSQGGPVIARTNSAGYAAIGSIAPHARSTLRIVDSDLPENMATNGSLVDKSLGKWTVAKFQPQVRDVLPATLRLLQSNGKPVPTNSFMRAPGQWLVVLDDGEVYVDDLATMPARAEVRMAGTGERCMVSLPEQRAELAASVHTLTCDDVEPGTGAGVGTGTKDKTAIKVKATKTAVVRAIDSLSEQLSNSN